MKRPGTGLVVSDRDVDWQDWNTNSNLDGVPRYKTHFSSGETPTKGLVQGLQPIYRVVANPLPWLDAMLNGAEHTNFFENRSTEYSRAATRGS
jgi:hypothetical protein